MKHLRLFSLLALFILVLSPVAAFAQDGPEMKEFASEDEQLTILYPAEWSIQDSMADSGLPSMTLTNSEEALQRAADGEDLASGDAEILVLLLPSGAFAMLGAELPADGSPADLAQTVADFLIGAPDPTATEEPQTQTGKAEEVELGKDGPTAGYLTVTSDTAEGALIVYELKDGVLAITIVAAYPGEFNDDLNTLGLAVAGSIDYAGTADELLTLMMGGSATEATPEVTEAPAN